MKRRLLVAALAVGVLLVGAAGAWAAFVTEGSPYPLVGQPLSIATADFNGDGRPDVATMDGNGNGTAVFLRQPGGGFAQEAGSPFSPGGSPSGIAIADFNADGRPDIAISNLSGAITVLLRQAGGGFAPGAGFSAAAGALGITAGEFGGDSHPDLAVTTSNNAVTVFLGSGTGFAAQTPMATGNYPRTVTSGDFNGDGLADLAVINQQDNTVTTLVRLAGGGFVNQGTTAVGLTPQSLAAADFNGDKLADLAVTSSGSNSVTVLLRNATGTGFTQEGSPIAVSASPVGSTTGDFDLDGRPDIAVAANSGAVDVLRRNAAGGFTRDPAIPLAGAVNGVAAADFDSNGRADLAAVSYSPEQFVALLNPAPAAPTPTPVAPVATPTPLPNPVAGKTVNVAPRSGKVTVKRPGSKSFVMLTGGAQIPVGSSIDTRNGRITITAAQAKGKVASADFYEGLFKLTQTKGAKPVTTLTLTEALSCPKRGKASSAAKKPKKRRLWGDGSGSFRTEGEYSAATIRGTRWLVEDTCTATTTTVRKGVVSVRDNVRHKTILVRAGHHYTARAKR